MCRCSESPGAARSRVGSCLVAFDSCGGDTGVGSAIVDTVLQAKSQVHVEAHQGQTCQDELIRCYIYILTENLLYLLHLDVVFSRMIYTAPRVRERVVPVVGQCAVVPTR
jgi:hypothetical protein